MIVGEHIKVGYGKNIILNDIDFGIDVGINGFLGANGVGKSTFFKMILGELKPIEGNLKIDMPKNNSFMGYLPQSFQGYPMMKVYEFLKFMSELRSYHNKISRKNQCEEIERKLHTFSLESLKNKKLKTLSGGQLRRVGLAQATLFDPYIIILDEPTTGLDPNERIKFCKYLKNYHTIVLCYYPRILFLI